MKLTIHIDGGARGNPGTAGAGVTIQDGDEEIIFEGAFYLGHMTNNMAEYNGLLKSLEVAKRLEATDLQIYSDSELMVRQINGEYRVKNANLTDLYAAAVEGLGAFDHWQLRHVRREGNHRADQLANMAMDTERDVVVKG